MASSKREDNDSIMGNERRREPMTETASPPRVDERGGQWSASTVVDALTRIQTLEGVAA